MKISYSWLKDYIATLPPPQELGQRLLRLGFEVASVDSLGPSFSGVVTAEILSIRNHPNADRLSLCEVTDGSQTFSVVCGATNIAVGQRVPLARVGAKLPGGVTISRAKIRGAESEGMLCSAVELGLPSNGADRAIHILPPETAVGQPLERVLGGVEWTLDVAVTPNRPDCLSHYGLARELAIHLDLSLKDPALDPIDDALAAPAVQNLEPENCPRYIGRVLEGVRVGPSPAWLASRLAAVGLRSINNVVDVTNYVLFELGQPLHAFDLDKLDGRRVVVRRAQNGETIRALDGQEYDLMEENLVIADASKPAAIAGVIGGEATGVSEGTTQVLLESACFNPALIRKSAKRLGLRTDSSYRFERGTDIDAAPWASARAAGLIKRLCAAKAGKPTDSYPRPKEAVRIEVSTERINMILGSSYPQDRVENKLKQLGRCENVPGGLRLYVPHHRIDLKTPWDVAEEIGRHLGYDSIPYQAAPIPMLEPRTLPVLELIERLRAVLTGYGFCEAYNYDFVSAAELKRCGLDPESPELAKVLNPLSADWSFLRPNMLPGLLRNAELNFNRDAKGLRLFEIGKKYTRDGEKLALAGILSGAEPMLKGWPITAKEQNPYDMFVHVRALIASLFEQFEVRFEASAPSAIFHPTLYRKILVQGKPLGEAGLLHPDLAQRWDLRGHATAAFTLDIEPLLPLSAGTEKYKRYGVFPSSSRDISIEVKESLSFDAIFDYMFELSNEIKQLTNFSLADVFTDEKKLKGKKSILLQLTFSDPNRTLRDDEIAGYTKAIVEALGKKFGAKLRS